MVFPLHSVSGPGSKQLLNDGIEPISNRLKNQQAVTTPPAGRAGYGGGGGGGGGGAVGKPVEAPGDWGSNLCFSRKSDKHFNLRSHPRGADYDSQIVSGRRSKMHSAAAFDWHMTALLHKVRVPEIRQHP